VQQAAPQAPPRTSAPRRSARASEPPAPVPAPASGRIEARSGRFGRRPAWPDETDRMWRCELRWDPRLVKSRFDAVAYGPGERQGRSIGESPTFRRQMMADADPAALRREYQTEVRRLSAALEAAGWEYVGHGTNWYSARFVWRRPGTPPDRIEPLPQLTGHGP
jgi:hypothetical protein